MSRLSVALGIAVMTTGVVVLALDVPRWNTLWFLFGWVGWLFVLDGLIGLSGGVPFATGRRRELAAMVLVSMPYWCLFEAYNLRLENWYYVFLPHSEVAQAAFATLAFATVLPACFFHADLLRVWGVFERVRWPRLRVSLGVEAFLVVFGALCIVLPLTHPVPAFWMVWGFPLGIPLVVNRRLGAESLLADLEAGRPARLLRLLTGGLVAGGVWEGLNYGARAKWIYTVPGLEEVKLFEMPVLGFLGFPVLAVASFSAYSLWCHLTRAGRHWEWADEDQPGPVLPRHRYVAMAAVVAFSTGASLVTMDPAVQARRPLLETIGLTPVPGIETPERLVRAVHADGVDAVSLRMGADVTVPYEVAVLALHKGMGADAALRLHGSGLTTPERLADADPDDVVAVTGARPTQARLWVRTARGGARR